MSKKEIKIGSFHETFDEMDAVKFQSQMAKGHVPFKVGLANDANNCFINSILQCLFHIKVFIPSFLNNDIVPLYYASEDWGILKDFATIMGVGYINEFSRKTLNKFLDRVYHSKSLFRRGRQHDAHEFLTYFLNTLKNLLEEKQLALALASEMYELNTEDIFDAADTSHQNLNQCYLSYRQRTVCEHGHVSIIENDHEILSVDVDRVLDVNQSISRFFADVVFGRCMCHIDSCFCNAYSCGACGKHVSAIQTKTITSFPDVLIMHLKLFNQDLTGQFYKLKNRLNLRKDSLNICNYAEKSLNPMLKNYELFAACIHNGEGLDEGHYTSLCKSYADFKWRHYDDDKVNLSNVIFENINERIYEIGQPYILFYRATNSDQTDDLTCKTLMKSFSTISIEGNKSSPDHDLNQAITLNLNEIIDMLDKDREKEKRDIEREQQEVKEQREYEKEPEILIKFKKKVSNDDNKNNNITSQAADSMDEYMDEILKLPQMQANYHKTNELTEKSENKFKKNESSLQIKRLQDNKVSGAKKKSYATLKKNLKENAEYTIIKVRKGDKEKKAARKVEFNDIEEIELD